MAKQEIKFDKHNYRKHSDSNKATIARSLDECGAGRSILIDNEGEIIAGNGVYEQAKAKGIPVKVVETDGTELVVVKRTDLNTADEKRKRLALADNATSDNVEWDIPEIKADFGADELDSWGIELNFEVERMGGGFSEEDGEEEEKQPRETIAEAEELLNKAMQKNLQEFLRQIDLMWEHGWLCSGLTEGFCRAAFLKTKYYGAKFPQWISMYWCPQRFKTSANRRSIYEQAQVSAKEGKGGIAGFRTCSSDGNLSVLYINGSYPIADGRIPLDFSANLAANLIRTYAPEHASVLDPCHGWGGRYVGALLAQVSRYVGFDPSPYAHKGLERARDIFSEYEPDTSAEFFEQCFEDSTLEPCSFDFALTSPPYFDVEQYDGEQTSSKRFSNYDIWRDGFYSVLIKKVYDALKLNGVFCLQVGGQRYPLIEDGKAIAERIGFTIKDCVPDSSSTQSSFHTTEEKKTEQILILKKQ